MIPRHSIENHSIADAITLMVFVCAAVVVAVVTSHIVVVADVYVADSASVFVVEMIFFVSNIKRNRFPVLCAVVVLLFSVLL